MEKIKYYISANLDKDVKNVINEIRKEAYKYDFEEIKNPNEAKLIISIGGDGTFLESSKLSLNCEIFGVNKGTLGYLTEIEEKEIPKAIKNYSDNNYEIQKRMLLDCNFKKENKLASLLALNDVVISKNNSNIIGLDIYVDNIMINSYYADGIIISTPTGSTGYSLSCGGPIIDPSSEMIIITPIAPHTMINRSIIVSADSNIKIHLTNTRDFDNAKLLIDGKTEYINEGDFISINKSSQYIKLVSFDKHNFFEKIRQKMN